MITYKIVSHYSKALFQLATSNEHLEKQLLDLEWMLNLLKEIPALAQLIYHPFIENQEKKKILQKLFVYRLDVRLLHFLFFLIDKKRIQYLPKIVQDYHHLVDEQLGILEASLTTAVPIEEKMKEEIKTQLEKSYQKRVRIEEKIDPQVIGGIVLIIANQILDASIKTQLSELKENLLAVNI